MNRVRSLLFLCLAALTYGQTYDASLFSALKWRNIGPNRGGRSLACAGSPSRPLEYYFGAVGGGLWKTTDGGTTWKSVTDGQLTSSSVGAVAVSLSNPDVVYIGMGETELRGNIMQGDGVYKSVDAGKTWKKAGLANTQAIARLRVDPANPDIVYAAALGHPYGPNTERGVFRSTDGGQNWQKILYRDDHTGAVDLTLDPNDPKILYAALWEVYRTPWLLNDGGPGSGLFKSVDGGDHWTEITQNKGLPAGIIGKIGIAVSKADSKRVYALVESNRDGLYRSDDAGETWSLISEDRRVLQRAFYFHRIYADPKDKDTIYTMDVAFLKSTDGGKTWKVVRTPHSDHHDLWIDPNNNQRMINSNDGGGTVTVSGGATWTGEEYPTAQLYHVATTIDTPYHVCGAQQDNTTVCVQSEGGARRGGGGGNIGMFAALYSVAGGESGYVTPDPSNANIFYGGSQGALLTKFDRSSGATRDVQVYPLFFSGMPASSLKERWQWTYPIVFSPFDHHVLYTSSQHLWKTTNDGQTWEQISPDLTRADPETLGDSGGPITKDQNGPEVYGTIFTIAPSLKEANTIWTGSDDGLAYITRDGGKHWTNITPKELPKFSRISMIDASPHDEGTALLAAKRYQLDDRQPYIFLTHDFGKTWTKIVTGIPTDDFVHVAREDPARKGLLYAGTEHGIYVSFDDGEHWQSLRLELPDTQVSDLVLKDDDLVIATHGRSFWILDRIASLRQLEPSISTSALHLFKPDAAVRSFRPAVLDYYLQKEAKTVTIDILDASGKVVRSFTGSDEEEKKAKKAEEDDSDFGPPKAPPPARKAGTNRFTWDLRYAGSTVFEGEIMWGARAEQGPLAVPGHYQVRVTTDGVAQTQPLELKLDPRRHVTQEDLQKQFDLAIKIRDEVSLCDEMVIAIRKAKKDASASANLRDNLSTLEQEIYQVRNRANEDPLNFPIKINNQIAALARTVETGDNPPTAQDYEVYKLLTGRLDVIKKRFDNTLPAGLIP